MSATMPAETPEARELSLVGKVELRIALTDSDTRLETVLKTYLPPLLLKLASDYMSVRNKVISICQHVNTRIKPPSIKLPVGALLKQFKENQSSLVRHFDLLYIQQGIDRLPIQDRLDVLPIILHGLSINAKESPAHAAKLFNLFLKLLHDMKMPERGSEEDSCLRAKLGFATRTIDAEFVSTWLGKVFLFNANRSGMRNCQGLSVEDCSFLQLQGKEDTWMSNVSGGMNLAETKIIAARFLASGAFLDSERFLPALFASADTNSRLSDIGDDILKRTTPTTSLEDPSLLANMFQVYLGTRGDDGSLPARVPLQTKILAFLGRSKRAASFVSQSTQIIEEGLAPLENRNGNAGPNSQKQGLETSKLRGQIFAFTNWLARISSPTEISAFAPTLVHSLRNYIERQGWPQFDDNGTRPSAGELSSRSFGYESIGLLAMACPNELLLEPNLDLLRWLLNSLSTDPSGKDISLSIEQALGSVLGAFGGDLDAELEASLTALFLHHVQLQIGDVEDSQFKIVRSTRYVAVRFANRCLSYENTTARRINIFAMRSGPDERREVLEEAKKGLDPYWYRMLNPPKEDSIANDELKKTHKYRFPKFAELIEDFFGRNEEGNTSAIGGAWSRLANAYSPAIVFCRCILLYEALESANHAPIVDVDWERNLDALVTNNEEAREILRNYLRVTFTTKSKKRMALEGYLRATYSGMINEVVGGSNRAGDYLLELCSLSPDSALCGIVDDVSMLRNPIFANDHALQITASHIFGLLASHKESPQDTVKNLLQTFYQKINSWRQAVGSEVFQVQGAVLAVAFCFSRSSCRGNLSVDYEDHQQKFVLSILDILNDSRDKELQNAAIVAVAELSLFAILLPSTIPLPHSSLSLMGKLKEKADGGDEKAIMALGYFATQCKEEHHKTSTLSQIIEMLYKAHEIRQPEIQFAVGSALSCAALGWGSKALIATLDIEGAPPQAPERTLTMTTMLRKILVDCKTTKPALRQASVIWLLCLVEYCGHVQEVQSRLRECQAAFKGFLADRDLLNQESASRGLALVYKKGDQALKDDLIRDLVGSFTGTTAGLAGNVSDETELFDAGALPTGEGSVTTYKDIMSLAAEVGDSNLVYRFMSLASNNAIWSSRAAFGRFGLSTLLSDSSVDGYLAENPKLYPALFRYRFDPNSNVRSSMNDIWAALVKDPSKTIDLYFDSIMDDLLRNILGKEWRVRQASCAAIADLVQGRSIEKYEKYLSQIWMLTFKVCDDIKESVRTAAMALARVLTGTLTRSLEAGESSARSAAAMLKNVVPFLLSPSGLESSAQEVQAFALSTLLQIIKSSNGKTLRPFVPDLVGHLIALLSSLEPQAINYIHLNADKYNMTTQQIDDIRLTQVRGSPMMEAIERCLDFLDEDLMPDFQRSLENAIKTAVGLPSKVGCSRVLVSLSTRHNFIFKDYANHFLRVARKQVIDRNDTISSSYAAACGYLARLASDGEILKIMDYCKALFFDAEDDGQRLVSGDLVHAISKYATDRFNSLAGEILPFVFVAKHDVHERVKTLFSETWSENVGGSRAVLLYLREIVDLVTQHLGSPRWSVKHTSALAIADVVDSSGEEISDSNAKIIWPALEKAVGGKTWEGKDTVLKAFITFVKHSTMLKVNKKIGDQMQMIIIRESKRNNPRYRQHALACLGEFVELRDSVDMYPQVYEITEPVIQEALSGSGDMDIDSPTGGPSSKSISEETLATALATLLKSIHPKSRNELDLISSLSQSIELVTKAISSSGHRVLLNAIYDAEKLLFEELGALEQMTEALEGVLIEFVNSLFSPANQVEQTRIKVADAAIALSSFARRGQRIRSVLERKIAEAQQQEPSITVQQSLDLAKKALET